MEKMNAEYEFSEKYQKQHFVDGKAYVYLKIDFKEKRYYLYHIVPIHPESHQEPESTNFSFIGGDLSDYNYQQAILRCINKAINFACQELNIIAQPPQQSAP